MPQTKDRQSLLVPLMIILTGLSVVVTLAVLIWSDPGDAPKASIPETSTSKEQAEPIILTGNAPPAVDPAVTPGPTQPTDDNGRSLDEVEAHNKASADTVPARVPSPRISESHPPQLSDYEINDDIRKQMAAITESEIPRADKISQFKSMIKESDDHGVQLLAITHLTRLVPDDEYITLMGPELIESSQSEFVLSALFRDLRTRPNTIYLPVLMSVVETENHPLANSASESIRAYLGDAYVEDPKKLREVVTQRLEGMSGGF